jgi:hypothetical protein
LRARHSCRLLDGLRLPQPLMPRLRRAARLLLALAVLAAVFALYTRPDFLLQLSNQIWTCF